MLKVQFRKMGITESETKTPPHRGSFTVTTWPCGPVATSHDALQPASLPFLPSLMSPALPPHPFFLKEQRTVKVPWKMGFKYKFLWNHEELNMCRGTCWCLHYSGMASSSNTELAEQSWLKWQLAHTKQKLPPNSLSVNEKVTFVRSF